MKYQELLNQIQSGAITGQNLYDSRVKLMNEIESITNRPLIIYAAKIESPKEAPNQIILEDVIGFSDLIANIDGDNLDILIESPGGVVDAAHRIVHVLRQKFKNIRFIIPGSAYSAATMISLSGNEILMDNRASLGPIDPQIGGIPARSILNGFNAVRDILKTQGAAALPAYLPLIQKYDLHIFEICKDAEERGKQLVADWLKLYMFDGDADKEEKAKKIVSFFADYDTHKSHARPIFFTDATNIGLKVSELTGDLKEKVWDLYLHIKILFDISTNVKIYENSKGINWGKQFNQMNAVRLPIQIPVAPQPASPR
jgi:hypothetical protein